MPGLLRGVARTAVIAGTASAVSGRVQRRQAEKFAGRDAQIYADRQQAYQQQVAAAHRRRPLWTVGAVGMLTSLSTRRSWVRVPYGLRDRVNRSLR